MRAGRRPCGWGACRSRSNSRATIELRGTWRRPCNRTVRMDVHNRPIYSRLAVLLVLFLMHGGLVLIFLGEKPEYREQPESPEVPMTVFFIDSEPRAPPEGSRISRRPTVKRQKRLSTDAAISSLDTTAPSENQGPATPPPVDWLAEAERSATEIAARGEAGRAAESPTSPPVAAPWDLRPLLESTGHGLILRIPLEIPGKLIDHCFGNMDLGHDLTGHWERYQLGCAFRKQPARGDLFDSLRKPSQ